jgi:hypothetical protein
MTEACPKSVPTSDIQLGHILASVYKVVPTVPTVPRVEIDYARVSPFRLFAQISRPTPKALGTVGTLGTRRLKYLNTGALSCPKFLSQLETVPSGRPFKPSPSGTCKRFQCPSRRGP